MPDKTIADAGVPVLVAQDNDDIPVNRPGPPDADGRVKAGSVAALAGPLSWFAQAGPISLTTTAEIQLAALTFTAKAARKYLIIASVLFTKDIGTTARAATLRLRRGTDNTGTLLASAAAASSGVASSPFGASLIFVHTPGAGAGTYRLSGLNFASATVPATQVNLAVVEMGA
jgi:hypothetical protein